MRAIVTSSIISAICFIAKKKLFRFKIPLKVQQIYSFIALCIKSSLQVNLIFDIHA